MTDLEQSVAGEDVLERRLVSSWKTEGPSPGAKAATLALLAGGATAAALGAGAKGGVVATKLAGAGLGLTLKVAAACVLAGAAVGGAAYVARAPARPSRQAAAPPRALAAPTVTTTTTTPTPTAPALAPVTVESLPSASPASPAAPAAPFAAEPRAAVRSSAAAPAASAATPAAASTRTNPSLDDQIAALDRARAALERGDAAECLAVIAGYDRSFPNGMLSQEATLLRVQALVQQGERTAARDVADRFLASHPASPHEQRMRRLLEHIP